MSTVFRNLLKNVGSGAHTHKDLSRAEAETAARMMLLGEATPAQIGAFLIAHRIKRPTPSELAGILDAYDSLGSSLPDLPLGQPLRIFGHPYDGRERSTPVAPLVSLILAAAGIPTLQHGSDVCPTKYGVPLVSLWKQLGIPWAGLALDRVAECLQQHRLGFIHLPTHFPLAQGLMVYRDEIGKRPPLATVELMWSPYQGPVHVFSGFVHPPTEVMMLEVGSLRGIPAFTTVKGLEGSCDLPRSRTAILHHNGERLLLKARDYGLEGSDTAFPGLEVWQQQAMGVLQGDPSSPLWPDVLWSGGTFLWLTGSALTLEMGLDHAKSLLQDGSVLSTLTELQTQLNPPPH